MIDLSWFEAPPEAKEKLYRAVLSWEKCKEAEGYIEQALEIAGENLDVLTSAYRFFFYRHDYSKAMDIALRVMELVRKEKNMPEEKEELLTYLRENMEDYRVRLYISACTACAFILLKLGSVEDAREILSALQELDHKSEFGVPVLLDLMRLEHEDIL